METYYLYTRPIEEAMYEEGTQLTRLRDTKQIEEVDEECSRQMYEYLMDKLHKKGFEHYEISNFCRPGFHSRHNSGYWDGTHYLGFGAAAHSYDGKTRCWNPSDLPIYIIGIEKGHFNPENGTPLNQETETLSPSQLYDERIMTGLRTARGVDLQRLKADFGQKYYDYCLRMAEKHLKSGLLSIKKDCASHFSLEDTAPQNINNTQFSGKQFLSPSSFTLPSLTGGAGGGSSFLCLTRSGLFVSDDVMSDLMYL